MSLTPIQFNSTITNGKSKEILSVVATAAGSQAIEFTSEADLLFGYVCRRATDSGHVEVTISTVRMNIGLPGRLNTVLA